VPDTQSSAQHPFARIPDPGTASGFWLGLGLRVLQARGQDSRVRGHDVLPQGGIDECVERWVRGDIREGWRWLARGGWTTLRDDNMLAARASVVVATVAIRESGGAGVGASIGED